MKNENLLPCPICGDKAELIEQKHREYPSTFYVTCKRRCVRQYDRATDIGAVRDWNMRKVVENFYRIGKFDRHSDGKFYFSEEYQ